MDIQNAFDALTDLVSEIISAGFASSIAQHDAALETVRDLRSGALIQQVLGAQLSKLASQFRSEVERKTVIRFRAHRKHPRMTREPLIDEAEAADVDLNVAVLGAQSTSGGAASKLALALAIMRVTAVTTAIGLECIYPPHDPTKVGRAGPRQRRREITAADVPDALSEILLRPVGSDEEQDAIVISLRAFENQMVNAGGIVTKLVALIDQPDGHVALNTVAGRIRRARHDRGLGRDVDVLTHAASPQKTTTGIDEIEPRLGHGSPVAKDDPVSELIAAPAPPALPPPSITSSAASEEALVPRRDSLSARFSQLSPTVSSTTERLKQAHADRKGRPR